MTTIAVQLALVYLSKVAIFEIVNMRPQTISETVERCIE